MGRWWRTVSSSHWRRRGPRTALLAQGWRARRCGSLADAWLAGDRGCYSCGDMGSEHGGDRSAVGICTRWRRLGDGCYWLGLGATAPRPRPHQRLRGQPIARAGRHPMGRRLACPHITRGLRGRATSRAHAYRRRSRSCRGARVRKAHADRLGDRPGTGQPSFHFQLPASRRRTTRATPA